MAVNISFNKKSDDVEWCFREFVEAEGILKLSQMKFVWNRRFFSVIDRFFEETFNFMGGKICESL